MLEIWLVQNRHDRLDINYNQTHRDLWYEGTISGSEMSKNTELFTATTVRAL